MTKFVTNIRIFTIAILLNLSISAAFCADTVSDELKQPAYRLGTTDGLENRYQTVDTLTPKINPVYEVFQQNHTPQYSYADSNLKMLSNEISQELSAESDRVFEEISILWDGAIRKSETIKFAI